MSTRILALMVFGSTLLACGEVKQEIGHDKVNWENREITSPLHDSLQAGTTYLSVYSQIYSQTDRNTKDLTVTVSLRNTDAKERIFIESAHYYDTKGDLIVSYFSTPIYLEPMETVDIIIDETDQLGGTGGNFIFDWKIKPNCTEPIFEAVMISTAGQQGLSFVTTGKRIN